MAGAISFSGVGLLSADATVVLVSFEAGREAFELDDAAAASFFGGSFDLTGAAASGRESAGTVAMDGGVPRSAGVVAELPFVLVSAALASRCMGVAAALGFAVVLSEEEVTRSSTTAPPITVTVIAANAMPKWFTESSCTGVIGIGTGRADAVARNGKESEAAYRFACFLPTSAASLVRP